MNSEIVVLFVSCFLLQNVAAVEWESISTEFHKRLVSAEKVEDNWIIKFRKSSSDGTWNVRFDDVTNGLKRMDLERPFIESVKWIARKDPDFKTIQFMLSTADGNNWKAFAEKVLEENLKKSEQGNVSNYDKQLTNKFISSEQGKSLLNDLQAKWPKAFLSLHGGESSYDYDANKKMAVIGTGNLVLIVGRAN